jgi:simple sugar transport system ATP-binding protein
MDSILQMHNISKTFGEVQALRSVDFAVSRGEVVGLLGDNGAGKSTLIKIVTGYHHPDTDGGEILFKGQKIEGLSVSEARKLGIETVYQERALADLQTLWRNIFMGRELTNSLGFINVKKMKQETEKLMVGSMGFTSAAVASDSIVRTFSGGEKQGVAIVRALHFDAELIILDEPTMGLSLSETKKLLAFVRGIKEAGKSCIFIDHNVFHVYSVADRVVVLDRGAVAGEFMTKDITLEQLMDKMYRVAQTGHLNGNGSE